MESTDTHFTSRTLSVILCCTKKKKANQWRRRERDTVDWPLSDTNYVLSAIIREISAPSLQYDDNTRTGKELSSGVTSGTVWAGRTLPLRFMIYLNLFFIIIIFIFTVFCSSWMLLSQFLSSWDICLRGIEMFKCAIMLYWNTVIWRNYRIKLHLNRIRLLYVWFSSFQINNISTNCITFYGLLKEPKVVCKNNNNKKDKTKIKKKVTKNKPHILSSIFEDLRWHWRLLHFKN